MLDLLVISHACFTAINRKVYRFFIAENWKVEIVIPEELQFPSMKKKADARMEDDPPLHNLKLIGSNPRTYRFEGLEELLNELQPRRILLDNDPVSEMAGAVGRWAVANGCLFCCISCENLSLKIYDSVRRRGWRNLPAVLYKRYLLRRNRKLIGCVFTINQDGTEIFRKEGFRKVQQIPLGFDAGIFKIQKEARQALREKLNLSALTFAYFGRLTPEKGIHLLIEALGNLKLYSWQLVMDHFDASSSDYAALVKKLIQNAGIDDRVCFVSPNHFEIAQYMNAVDLIVVPSVSNAVWKEQYGRVAAEALACGKKVVVSDSGSLPDLTAGFAAIFPEGDLAGLHAVLERELRGELIWKAPEEIAAYAKKHLSIDVQFEQMKNTLTH